MDTERTDIIDGRQRQLAAILLAPLLLIAGAALPMAADASNRPPVPLECQVRSAVAEARGDDLKAAAWAVSLAMLDPHSSYAASRVAGLYEGLGQDSAALVWGERALALDSLNGEAAMLVGRARFLAGEPELAAQVLTPPLRQSGAMPELYALRALAHELARNYLAALADLKRTGPLLPHFGWIATDILGMALEDGRLQEANSALQLAMELRPDDARVLTLGVSLAQRLDNPILERTLRQALHASEHSLMGRTPDVFANDDNAR